MTRRGEVGRDADALHPEPGTRAGGRDYWERTPLSRAAWQRARTRLPAGVTSNIRFFPPYPIVMSRAAGSRLVDVDGREYVDYCLAFGTLIAGHGHPRVVDAILAELARSGTVIFGAPTELELRLADRLARLIPAAEMVRFTTSGTESTMHAIRLARGATGRSRIVKFEGHYHGVHDAVLVGLDGTFPARPASDGIPAATREATVVLPFNDVDALRSTLEAADDVAAVIVEPVARGALAADDAFVRELRAITSRRGIVLIFDEVVSWPRVALGGAQQLLGVVPDLTALGKAVGGGLPLGALVGRADLMRLLEPRVARDAVDRRPYVAHAGTYTGAPPALAAGMAVLDLLETDGAFEALLALAEHARAELRELFRCQGLSVQVSGVGAAFDFHRTELPVRSVRDVEASDLRWRERLDYQLLERGIYNPPLHRFHLSLAHTADDIGRLLEIIESVLPGR